MPTHDMAQAKKVPPGLSSGARLRGDDGHAKRDRGPWLAWRVGADGLPPTWWGAPLPWTRGETDADKRQITYRPDGWWGDDALVDGLLLWLALCRPTVALLLGAQGGPATLARAAMARAYCRSQIKAGQTPKPGQLPITLPRKAREWAAEYESAAARVGTDLRERVEARLDQRPPPFAVLLRCAMSADDLLADLAGAGWLPSPRHLMPRASRSPLPPPKDRPSWTDAPSEAEDLFREQPTTLRKGNA